MKDKFDNVYAEVTLNSVPVSTLEELARIVEDLKGKGPSPEESAYVRGLNDGLNFSYRMAKRAGLGESFVRELEGYIPTQNRVKP